MDPTVCKHILTEISLIQIQQGIFMHLNFLIETFLN